MIMLVTKVRLTSLYFPRFPFLTFLKMRIMFPLFQSVAVHQTATTSQIGWIVAWPLHPPVPSGPQLRLIYSHAFVHEINKPEINEPGDHLWAS